MIAKGQEVTLTIGTTVLTRDPADRDPQNPWTGWTRYEVDGEFELSMVIDFVGVSHATMNGGGHDYYGHCPHSNFEMQVRTTLARGETATFAPVRP